ncbi:MAG TPA: PQQ-binding-like beta-propeller repeat protein [Acidiphilium sp.]|uniref:pyrroloquinoline quinone-dependent dehydrogenase n=1 Tax=unclassified Acidiphilium TaxID=2617493 RepID=UPI000BC518C3|nr:MULTISPECIES: PQQ-binding-like beta-propeller repeat protein [unclassified Acidiphilium]OYV57380.1 MAG: pyrrolo-quinoline quinone [Acidiphilium sp. 20-67-58]OYV87299.1 MAG: pyrrolo-quinoline quinone [Acidiphilium sp. 21-68-69]HQT59761.1 PQQ-binding-like beta-propeller repeat protein [Acidiphilium sp.]HQU11378.1 PQQ-binding-like beta-propeller repeat protein [Acidiphilium sp.]
MTTTDNQSRLMRRVRLAALPAAALLGLALAQSAQAGAVKAEGSETGGQTAKVGKTITSDVNVSTTMLEAAPKADANWLVNGRDFDNSRFSPLKQIDSANVKDLAPVAIAQTGYSASFETTPLVVNGVMYLTTPMVNSKQALIAMNATNGQTLWTYTYTDGQNQICCGPVNRGAAASNGKVYMLTLDDHLVAVNAKTGEQEWSTTVADPRYGYSETMAPTVYKNMVIIGSAGGEWPIRGFVAAYDATTGKQIWRFHTTDSKAGWEGDSWKTGGGTVWTTPTVDPKRGLLIFATGNPNPDLNGSARKGDNRYTDSIVALNINTGKLVWYYQEVKHDVWDYDAVSNAMLFDVRDHGKMVPAVGEAGKTAWYYIVNRETGKLIRKSEPFDMQKNMFAQPTTKGVQMLPGANGGAEWSPPAFSPMTRDVYVMGMNQLMTFTNEKSSPAIPGQIRLGSTFKNVDHGIQNGTLTAINVDTGKIRWNDTLPEPMMGGVLATAGNLVFTGEGNGWFDAMDAKTGKRLWRFNLGAGVNAPPVAYSVNGREYIAVAAGGNFQLSYPYGDAVAIFALPKK